MKKNNFSFNDIKKKIKSIYEYVKNKYKVVFSNSPVLVCFIITSLINTWLLRVLTVHNFLYFKPLFFDLAFIVLISSFSFLLRNKKKQTRYLLFFSIFTSVLCIVHSMYYTYYDSFASVSLLATSAFVVDVGDAVVKQVLQLHDFVYLWQPFVMFYLLYHLKKHNHITEFSVKSNDKKNNKICFFTLVTTSCIIWLFGSLFVSSVEWSRFGKMWNRESVVSSFGVYTYQMNDIFQSLEPKINNLFGHDSALRNVMDYYSNNNVDKKKNKYTDIFKGKNLLVIHAESLQTIAIDRKFENKEVTPFLNKIVKESIYFDNFYSEVGVGTSSDAEFTFSTSLMPSNSGTVFVNYFDRQYDSIQKQFKKNGYYVFSMHANTGDFWNRATMHDNLGYDKFYSKSSFEIDETIGLGLSDKSFFKQAVPKINDIMNEQKKPFYGLLITLTNHTPWSDFKLMDEFPTTWTVDVNGSDVTSNYINDTTLGNFFRSIHYFDQSFEQLFNDLDKEGILDNTVVVIYGDHDARISRKLYNIMYNYDPYTDLVKEEKDEGYIDYNSYMYELDRKVPLIIWTKDHKYKEKVSNAAGMIDVFPTLANMFGVDVSPYILGHDIFSMSDDENTVVFTDGSYVTNKIYYDGQSGDIYSIDGNTTNEEYVSSRAKYADSIIDVSNDIITYDLIKEMKNKEKID
ncbi:MAG: LTA synthase family protein [Bacilli bacterium]|nr:LTA synthase family protein [Bacilli bacterium]